MIRRLFIYLCFSLFVCTPGLASNDKALFWEISSPTAIVYLLGSIHFADESFYPLRKEIEQAFEESDNLVVETEMSDSDLARFRKIISSKGSYADGKTIKDHISASTYTQLTQRLQQLDIPLDHVKKQKPGMLVMTLTSAQVMKMGFDPQLGIDAHFIARAKGNRKIIPLETIEQQLDLLLNIADAELLLRESLHSMDEAESMMDDMVVMWKQGDVQALHKLLFEDTLKDYPVFASIYDSLFYQRNQNMTTAISSFLNSSETYFVVVGAGHLVGEQGIVNLLSQAGHEVKRL